MDRDFGILCAGGFSFFGISNRLISHKLRNKLAIISETSGLLNDLVELSPDVTKLEPGKLRSLTESIAEEVARANALVGHMNAFAHSVDKFFMDVDIRDILRLVIAIAQLDTYPENTKLRFVETEACMAYTSPFFLGNLFYEVITLSLSTAGPQGEIRVSVHPESDGLRISFSGIAADEPKFTTGKVALVANALSAKISFNTSSSEFNIILPRRIGESALQNLSPDE
jgi:light-regulated signal transduction histidine kinase (bacteriophytochrome)